MQDAQQQQDAIRRIATALRNAATRPEKCTLLIGAGCSVTAGIKSAAGIVDDIRDSRGKTEDLSYYYDNALARAQQRNPKAIRPDYGDCMAELPPGPQRALLRGYIDRAKLNWAHVGIGALVANGYVDRILTTNFDPLIARGCAVFHEYPAVYDLTMSPKIKTADLPDRAVFHLHGQRNGFSLLNSDVELDEHKQHLKPLFDHARGNRTWIVCGYSGDNDPLMDFIVDQVRYDYELFWIGIDDTAPERLRPLTDNCERSFCRYFEFPGADEFFIRLANELGLFPFTFMNRPLDHLRAMIEGFTEFPLRATDTGLDLLQDTRKLLDAYQTAYESGSSSTKTVDQSLAEQIAGQGESAVDDATLSGKNENRMSASMRSIAAFIAGNRALERAHSAGSSKAALRHFQTAALHFADAARYDPMDHKALTNWGVALAGQAECGSDAEAGQLWIDAGEKYAAALAIKPDTHYALNNWGNALDEQAKRSSDDEAHRLWAEAAEKYAAALAIKPDKHEALNNWGSTLDAQARRSPDDEARRLWAEAAEKYAAALAIKPDMHETLNNWGTSLDEQAKRSSEAEAHRFWVEACEKFAAAVAIKPDMHKAFSSWGSALAAQAQRSADANTRRQLFAEAEGKLLSAEAIAAGAGAYNLACLHSLQGDVSMAIEWLDRALAAGELPTREHIEADDDFAAIREHPEFVAWLKKQGWAP